MRKLLLALSLFFVVGISDQAQSQNININLNVNLDRQPAWGPVGYNYARYYYIPEINVYYDVTNALFYYLSRGKWIRARYLPYSYRRYDLYGMYKVVLKEPNPWLHNRYHKKSYSRYRGDRTQVAIRYSHDNRYRNSRNNNRNWVDSNAKPHPNKGKNKNTIKNNPKNKPNEKGNSHRNENKGSSHRTPNGNSGRADTPHRR